MTGNILVLTDRRYRDQLQPLGMVNSLLKRGARVSVFDETQVHTRQWREAVRTCDLLVARGRQPRLLEALDRAREEGARVLDAADSIENVRDKRLMTAAFADAGIPMPHTVIGSVSDVLDSDLVYPLICKPIFGDNSAGLVIVDTPEELAALTWPEPELIAQEYHPGDGVDLKLYVIDDTVTAVRKASPITGCRVTELGAVALTDHLAGLARRCAALFDLNLCGVD
ncbi:MAG: hypothetical protein GXX86_10730, partial [Propionibacterium sp.]|nr:hypothetical protein [Propionibacterium sp.]